MTALQYLNAAIVMLGLPTIIGACLYVGRKLQVLDTLNESTVKMKHNMKVVSDYLTRRHSKFDPTELQSFSPFRLTLAGEKFIKDIGFENVFKANKKEFFDFIDAEKPKLKYDVEALAIKSVYALNDRPYMDFLKVFFYNNPKRSIEDTAPTLGVYIRDEYLEEHPEITQ